MSLSPNYRWGALRLGSDMRSPHRSALMRALGFFGGPSCVVLTLQWEEGALGFSRGGPLEF